MMNVPFIQCTIQSAKGRSDTPFRLHSGQSTRRAIASESDWRTRSEPVEYRISCNTRGFFNNSLLIAAGHYAAYTEGRVPDPSPTYVAGFRQWQSLGRHVVKGQSGYGILAPVTARFASRTPADPGSWHRLVRGAKPAPGEVVTSRLIALKPTHVWDVTQTDGDPLPEPPRPVLLHGQAPAGLWAGLTDQITAQGYELRLVSSAAAIGGANGLTDFLTREVSVRTDMDDSAMAKTLAHELGHCALHAPSSVSEAGLAAEATLHRGIAEVEAESVALMVGAAHGMDTSAYTIPYVATWATSVPGKTPVEVVQATAERVRTTALGILDRLDTPQISDGDPPGLDRTALAHPAATRPVRAKTAMVEL